MILNPQHIHHVWKKAANQVTRNLYLQISVRHYQTTSRFIAGGGITMLIKQMSTVLNTFQAAYKNKASFFPKEQSPISDCLQHTHTQSFIYTFSLITWWFPSNARSSLSPHPATVSLEAAIWSLWTTFWELKVCLVKVWTLVWKNFPWHWKFRATSVCVCVSVSAAVHCAQLPLNSSAIVFSAQAFMMSLQT